MDRFAYTKRSILCVAVFMMSVLSAAPAQSYDPQRWESRFTFRPPEVSTSGVATGTIGALPSFTATAGEMGQPTRVRVSLPFAPGAFPASLGLVVQAGDTSIQPGVRILTLHPGQPASVRRAVITFPYTFPDRKQERFQLDLVEDPDPTHSEPVKVEEEYEIRCGDTVARLSTTGVAITSGNSEWSSTLIAPVAEAAGTPKLEVIEQNLHFTWVRLLQFDTAWPRILELRIDSMGNVEASAHVQRLGTGDSSAPDLGWQLHVNKSIEPINHAFANGVPLELKIPDSSCRLVFPFAAQYRKGHVQTMAAPVGSGVSYLRCTEADGVPMQEASWRSASFALVCTASADSTHVSAEAFDAIYQCGMDTSLVLYPELTALRAYFRHGITNSRLMGDDFGNVTAFSHGGGVSTGGMNRLNHCPAIFEEYFRSGNPALRDTAVEWCVNMYDLSIWWGDTPDCGGTRYNNAFKDDPNFMWRKNGESVTFCTKGYDAFFYAYEETGDPRMAVALRNQVDYAKHYVHVDQGEARNIGDALDFIRLYRFTGIEAYRDNALRLFHELRTKLGDDNLFSQGGQPIQEVLPFIDNDAVGTKNPFAKPYIIGYALQGLPELVRDFPDEPRLLDTVRAVARFLAESQDPLGGWRYPHPKSSGMILNQALEHGAQIMRAAEVLHTRGEPIGDLLDALELILKAHLNSYVRNGTVLSGLGGWESAAGVLNNTTMDALYSHPNDRDPSRDYSEGAVSLGSVPPDGLVYFSQVLAFYLRHRPAERLYHAGPLLKQVVERTPDARLSIQAMDGSPRVRIALTEDASESVEYDLPAPSLSPEQIRWTTDEEDASKSYVVTLPDGRYTVRITPFPGYAFWSFTYWPNEATEAPSITVKHGPVADTSDSPTFSPSATRSHGGFSIFSSTSNLRFQGNVDKASSTDGPIMEHVLQPRPGEPVTVRGHLTLSGDISSVPGTVLKAIHEQFTRSLPSPSASVAQSATYGLRDFLPTFNRARIERMDFDWAWENHSADPVREWRMAARAQYLKCLGPRPELSPFHVSVTEEEDRGSYIARKIAFNLSADERVKAYMLIPKGDGPFPAVVGLHDHGAHFSIGKEKVIRPFGERDEVLKDATDWTGKYYGGRWFGDELAKRGYVVFATDALFWGDRGRFGGVEYEDQQALGANMLQLGLVWAGKIVWDDVRSAEFVQGLPEVDPDRIACMGLSMGSHRTWSLAAATDIVKAGAAICWMGDTPSLAAPGNNQTKGHSAFSMLLPGVRNALDYPDVASIAAPKPMLFFNGLQDGLFPVAGVEAAYVKMQRVWAAAGVPENLKTELWDVPHEYNAAMQDKAFAWLDSQINP
ncbi:MAG: hypothetical protein AMXMBFR84_49120 [Candidatus Hydrogenedentota bacterium]